jgi:hypothetical protein
MECYDPLFVLECSPDLVTKGYRVHDKHCPSMIVESHEEGTFKLADSVKLDEWYDVGHVIGEIDDGDDDDDDHHGDEWLWQAYSYEVDDHNETSQQQEGS